MDLQIVNEFAKVENVKPKYIYICVCVCVCARTRACAHARVCVYKIRNFKKSIKYASLLIRRVSRQLRYSSLRVVVS